MTNLAQRLANLSPEQRRRLHSGLAREVTAPQHTVEGRATFPLSFAQQRLWVLNAIQENDATYLVPGALRLIGRLDVAAFEHCLKTIVARHATLRTVFDNIDGEARQRILDIRDVSIAFPIVDMSIYDASERENKARKLIEEELRRPFDLSRAPLLRMLIVDMGGAERDEHILVFTMHHIISDGWSCQVLVREFAELYEARIAGRDADLAALPLQYADYALWQRDWLKESLLERQLAWWREALKEANFTLDLPTDRIRPPAQDNAGRTLCFEVPSDLAQTLRELARANGSTLHMVLLAAYFVLLSRWSGQKDICVGGPVANRRRVEHEALIGFFVNTLVLRGDLSGDPTFVDFLSRIKAFCLGAQEHQDLPFERLVEALAPTRDLSRTPLFQTMFGLQGEPAGSLTLPGLTIESYDVDCGVAKFDLSFDFTEASDGQINGEAEFATALFDETTVARMVVHYVRLLGSIVATPMARISELSMLPSEERDLLLNGLNATDASLPNNSIVDVFALQAKLSPDATAVCDKAGSLSYRDLDRRSDRLARELIARGATHEKIIGLCLDRSIEMVVALLAVLKCGAAYLPLDPDYPQTRLSDMITDAAPLLTLAHSSIREKLPSVRMVCIDALGAENSPNAWDDAPLDCRVSMQSIAYVIYTSGSTGSPKGAAISHASLANLIQSQIRSYDLGSGDRVLQLASPSFDLSVEEIFTALCSGATLVLSPGLFADSWATFHNLIEDKGITFVSAPTAVWRHYTHWLAATDTMAPACLRRLSTGTEAADTTTLGLWRSYAPHVQWTNAYGPTETTVTATSWRLSEDVATLNDVPIGAPIYNVRVYLLDAYLEPVALGAIGEIYIGGAGVARGYLNRPDITAEQFVPDPFGPAGARLYRTGDLGRRRADGQLLFVGRSDAQVKIRGYRVEPCEIERALGKLPLIRAAAVVARDHARGDKGLVAFVVMEDESAFDAEATKAALRAVLPDFMIPALIVSLKALPFNANGKIDRSALSYDGANLESDNYVAPRNSIEEAICRVWAKVLNIPRFGATDNFFEAGGHSLLALRAVDEMRRAGLTAEARTIFAAPTPEQFARALNISGVRPVPPNGIPSDCAAITPEMITLAALTQDEIDHLVAAIPGGARNIQDIYPLAPLQEGILFHHLMNDEGDPYLSPLQFAFGSHERLESFVAALQTLVAQHDVLRTAIAYEQLAEPVQIVWRHAHLELCELPAMTAQDMRERVHFSRYRLDIRSAPLMRLFVSRDPEDGRWRLLMLVHHLVLDHVTTERLLDQLRKSLTGQESGETPSLYRNFVSQTRSSLSQGEHEAFFTNMLGDFAEPTTPLNLASARGNGSANMAAVLPLDDELSRRLRAAARKLGVSSASIFHVAFARLIAQLSGRDDVVFGTVMFGRMNGVSANGLGMYINTLPFRLKLAGLDVRRAVQQAQQALTLLLAHEHASLALAQRCSGVPQPAPLFTTLLNYRHSRVEEAGQDGSFGLAEGIELIFAEESSNYPFDLSIDDFGDSFSIEMQSLPEVDPHCICGQMRTVVDGLVEALELRPDRDILDIEILSVDERAQLLHGFNTRQADFAKDVTVVDLFSAQARQSPDTTALICGGETLGYGELDRRANRLAHLLIERGAGPDHLVGICIERSIDMVVALLGILKSGAGYLPLDPNYPPARLTFMTQESQPLLILTRNSVDRRLSESAPVLAVDDPKAMAFMPAQSDAAPPLLILNESVAYAIYTSGSTGAPKGVAISHGNLANLIQSQIRSYELGSGDRVLQLASLSFDLSVEEIFTALCSGATLVLSPGLFADSWATFHDLIEDKGITFVSAPTAVWRHYTHWLAATDTMAPACLRRLSTGTEAADVTTLGLWRSYAPHVQWTNAYGPTETTVTATSWRLSEDVATLNDVPIGQAITNGCVYLLDGRLEPVPIGVAGEIFIGGAGVARGYVARPDLTAERFFPDPYGPPGARLYRTGDLARRRADGALIFVGRADTQVKIRGFRIELGEIESALLRVANIRAAAVDVRKLSVDDSQLVAFVTTDNPGVFDPEATRAALRDVLPDYMIPAVIIALPQLPLNASGKIDRSALPDLAAMRDRPDFAAPETKTERTLCDAWSQALGVDRVSTLDNFFAIGGHSLAVMQMATRLSQTLGVTIPLALVYQTETLRELAAAIDAAAALRTQKACEAADEEFEEFEL